MSRKEIQLVGDGDIAGLLSVSRSWVRKQRYNRRHGLPHVFDVDPIMVGSLPRYCLRDVLDWIEKCKPANDNIKPAGRTDR